MAGWDRVVADASYDSQRWKSWPWAWAWSTAWTSASSRWFSASDAGDWEADPVPTQSTANPESPAAMALCTS